MKYLTKTIVAVVALLCPAVICQAGVLLVAGSPEYDETTGNGFKGGGIAYPGSGVNNSGVAVGYAYHYKEGIEEGSVGVRWDASGTAAVELADLDMSSGTIISGASCGVNDATTIVGYGTKYVDGTNKGMRAMRWDTSGTAATELGNLGTTSDGYTDAIAYAVNEAGTVVGIALKCVDGVSQGIYAVRWDAGGTEVTQLDCLGTSSNGSTEANANALNNAGTAVGHVSKFVAGDAKGVRAVRWDAGTTIATELDNLGTDSNGFTYADANAINEAGTVVGYARKHTNGVNMGGRAVRWDAGSTIATELGNLGTSIDGYSGGGACAVNNVGTAVGAVAKFIDGRYKGHRAVRWDASGTAATELANLGTDSDGVSDTKAYDVNDAGTAVGYCEKYMDGVNVGDRAVIWLPDASAVDLNDLGVVPVLGSGNWILNTAKALSADGWVAGEGTFDPDGGGPLEGYTRLWVAQVGLGGKWTIAAGGLWGRGPNWSTGTPAMQVGDATFDLDASYTVTLDRDELTGSIAIDAGAVTIDLAGHSLGTENGITVAEGAMLNCDGTLAGDVVNDGTLEFGISGSTDYDSLDIAGLFTAGGTIAVELLGDFAPDSGDEFDLMDFAGFVNAGYQFDFSGASLSPGLEWDASMFAATGVVRVVPEPGVAVAIALGLMICACRRRAARAVA